MDISHNIKKYWDSGSPCRNPEQARTDLCLEMVPIEGNILYQANIKYTRSL